MKVGAAGGLLGRLLGLAVRVALFFIPGIGPLVVFGPLVSWIVGALEGAAVVGGLSALAAALYSIGIPKDSVMKYETAVKSAKFLVIAHGTADEAAKARSTSIRPARRKSTSIQEYAAKSRTVRLELTPALPGRRGYKKSGKGLLHDDGQWNGPTARNCVRMRKSNS